ncbi:glycosyltransferase [Shouchella clausii]|uniref:glycosyltransferase n=1 Tax=Shouchella clausii TaxID=79880 RepID=UPI001C22ED08|nr:glycosyltransferase [Shouchella clausii]MBU8595956.1 glycosyltransferase [Shouchella clausii]MED4157535.1 glycosyltransferase [Shouchella clausii]MED4175630.1 glycosyltransferase [Shouchella clausii]
MRIAICVITYKRPSGLRNLLTQINNQIIDSELLSYLEVIVVDNDFSGSGRNIVNEFKNRYNHTLKYEIEERQGIPYARNKSVRCSSENVDFIVFIDDDEVPSTNWLKELLKAQKKYSADVVEGRVVAEVNINTDQKWLLKGEFFNRKQQATGSRIQLAATNNLLIRKSILLQYPFNEKMVLTGGSDTYLFTQLCNQGYKMIYCNEAVVTEIIPESRMEESWLLKRSYRVGVTRAICTNAETHIYKAKVRRFLIGSLKIAQGIALIPISFFQSKEKRVKAKQKVCMGFGNIVGLFGIKYNEYKQTHGS